MLIFTVILILLVLYFVFAYGIRKYKQDSGEIDAALAGIRRKIEDDPEVGVIAPSDKKIPSSNTDGKHLVLERLYRIFTYKDQPGYWIDFELKKTIDDHVRFRLDEVVLVLNGRESKSDEILFVQLGPDEMHYIDNEAFDVYEMRRGFETYRFWCRFDADDASFTESDAVQIKLSVLSRFNTVLFSPQLLVSFKEMRNKSVRQTFGHIPVYAKHGIRRMLGRTDFDDYYGYEYGELNTTQSQNLPVLKLYAFMLQNQNNDSDFWSVSGDDNIVYILEQEFKNEDDWKALEQDLQHWSDFQLDLFTEGIMRGSDWPATVVNRIRLLPVLLDLAEKREGQTEIRVTVYDHIEMLQTAPALPLDVLKEIEKHFTGKNEPSYALEHIHAAMEKGSS